jgi:hypothetical protein
MDFKAAIILWYDNDGRDLDSFSPNVSLNYYLLIIVYKYIYEPCIQFTKSIWHVKSYIIKMLYYNMLLVNSLIRRFWSTQEFRLNLVLFGEIENRRYIFGKNIYSSGKASLARFKGKVPHFKMLRRIPIRGNQGSVVY